MQPVKAFFLATCASIVDEPGGIYMEIWGYGVVRATAAQPRGLDAPHVGIRRPWARLFLSQQFVAAVFVSSFSLLAAQAVSSSGSVPNTSPRIQIQSFDLEREN